MPQRPPAINGRRNFKNALSILASCGIVSSMCALNAAVKFGQVFDGPSILLRGCEISLVITVTCCVICVLGKITSWTIISMLAIICLLPAWLYPRSIKQGKDQAFNQGWQSLFTQFTHVLPSSDVKELPVPPMWDSTYTAALLHVSISNSSIEKAVELGGFHSATSDELAMPLILNDPSITAFGTYPKVYLMQSPHKLMMIITNSSRDEALFREIDLDAVGRGK